MYLFFCLPPSQPLTNRICFKHQHLKPTGFMETKIIHFSGPEVFKGLDSFEKLQKAAGLVDKVVIGMNSFKRVFVLYVSPLYKAPADIWKTLYCSQYHANCKSWLHKMKNPNQDQTNLTSFYLPVSPLEPLQQGAFPTEILFFLSVFFDQWHSGLLKLWSVIHGPMAQHSSWKYKNKVIFSHVLFVHHNLFPLRKMKIYQ